MGARELPRAGFEARLTRSLVAAPIREWTYDLSLWRHLAPDNATDRPQDTGT
jgi:hypothetical protein